MKRENKGITLIALIITIIIMLILAGVTISIVGGSDGIIAKVEKAVSETEKAAMQEDAELAIATIKMDYYEDYATNKNMTAKEFIVAKLQEGDYETSRGAVMAADDAGNITYTFDEVTTSLTIDENGKVTLGASSGSGDDSSDGTTTPAVQYTVTYNANGGTGAPTDSGEYAEGASVTVNFATIPTKSGYTFLGWATSASATTATYTSTGTTSFTMGTANVTLYAVWEETVAAIPTGLAVGDTVSYYPSGTYTWEAEYASSDLADDGTKDVALASGTSVSSSNQDMSISTWKVYSINETTGKVELVPSGETTNTVRLQGAQGYNNAVYLLNDACSNLYGDTTKGITARSLNMKDIEEAMTEEAVATVHSYNNGTVTWGEQIENPYTTNKSYPAIYAQENLSVINGTKNENGLGMNDQTALIGRTDGGATLGKLTASTSIQPYHTWNDFSVLFGGAGCEVMDNLPAYMKEGTFDLLFPNGSSSSFWVASRYVRADSSGCYFHVAGVYYGNLDAGGLCYSYGGSDYYSLGLFPVVSLKGSLLSGNSTDGWEVE